MKSSLLTQPLPLYLSPPYFPCPSPSCSPAHLYLFVSLTSLIPPLPRYNIPSSLSSFFSPSSNPLLSVLPYSLPSPPSRSHFSLSTFLLHFLFLCVVMRCFVYPGWGACLSRCHLHLRAGPSPPKKQARAKWVPSPSSPPSSHPLFSVCTCVCSHTSHSFYWFLINCTAEDTGEHKMTSHRFLGIESTCSFLYYHIF